MMSSAVVKVLGSRWVLQLDRLYYPVEQGGCVSVWLILYKEICFPHPGPGVLQNEIAVEIFSRVRGSGGQDRCLSQNEAGAGLLDLCRFLFFLPWETSVSFPRAFWEKRLGERVALSQKVTWEQFPVCPYSQPLVRSCFVPKGGFEHQLSWTISSLITYFNVPCTGHSWMWCSGQSHPRMLPFLYLTSDLWKQELIKSSKVAKRKGKCLVTN